jgi:hypothetical protein
MSTLKPTTHLVGSAAVSPQPSRAVREPQAVPATRVALFVTSGRGGGLRASIRGHLLELADPSSGRGLAPTPDDLRIASIASDFAWFARRFLRDRGLDDLVSVTARQCTTEGSPHVDGVDLAFTVSEQDAATRATLATALERESAGKFPDGRVRFNVGPQ